MWCTLCRCDTLYVIWQCRCDTLYVIWQCRDFLTLYTSCSLQKTFFSCKPPPCRRTHSSYNRLTPSSPPTPPKTHFFSFFFSRSEVDGFTLQGSMEAYTQRFDELRTVLLQHLGVPAQNIKMLSNFECFNLLRAAGTSGGAAQVQSVTVRMVQSVTVRMFSV